MNRLLLIFVALAVCGSTFAQTSSFTGGQWLFSRKNTGTAGFTNLPITLTNRQVFAVDGSNNPLAITLPVFSATPTAGQSPLLGGGGYLSTSIIDWTTALAARSSTGGNGDADGGKLVKFLPWGAIGASSQTVPDAGFAGEFQNTSTSTGAGGGLYAYTMHGAAISATAEGTNSHGLVVVKAGAAGDYLRLESSSGTPRWRFGKDNNIYYNNSAITITPPTHNGALMTTGTPVQAAQIEGLIPAVGVDGVALEVHTHDFSEVIGLPSTRPREASVLRVPLGESGDAVSKTLSLADAYYVMKVRPSGQNTVLALLDAGITPTDAQLTAINNWYAWADSVGFISGNKAGARMLVPVWNNHAANMINWVKPSDDGTLARRVGASAHLTTAAGYISSNMATASATQGYLALDTTSTAAWEAADWCMMYYSHLAAQTGDNAMIGARNDALAGADYRYINTTTATTFVFSAGYTVAGGSLVYTSSTATPLGLVYVGYKGTKLDALQKKSAGYTTLVDTSGSYSANLSVVPFLGLGYNSEGGASSLSGQPTSLFYVGKRISADTATAQAAATAFYDLVVALGAPSV